MKLDIIKKFISDNPELSHRETARRLIEGYLPDENLDTLRKFIGFIKESEPEFNEFEAEEAELPESDYIEPEVLEVGGKIGVINDVHLPYHSKRALQLALDYLHKINIDTLLLNGDIVDFYAISRFLRNPNYRDLNYEIKIANKFLDYIQSRFSNIVYKEGNHEVRLVHYISEKAPEMSNLDGLTLNSLLKLKERGIKFIDNRGLIKAGKLGIIHGNEISNGGIINVARVKILRAMDNLLFGHHHVTQDFTQRKLFGDTIGAWSVGCLCGLNPEYAKFNGWNNGFAWVEVTQNGEFEVHNKRIINYKVM